MLRGSLLLTENMHEDWPGPSDVTLDLIDLETLEERQIVRLPLPGPVAYGEAGYLEPDMDTGHVVWSAPGGRSREIFAYDLATGISARLTDDQGTDFRPRVADELVVWLLGTQTSAEVYADNLETSEQEKLGGGPERRAAG